MTPEEKAAAIAKARAVLQKKQVEKIEDNLPAQLADDKQAKKAEAIAKVKAALQKKQAEQEKEASQPAQPVDEKQAKKAEAIAKAKAVLQKKQESQGKEAGLSAHPVDEKQAKKAEAIAKAKAVLQKKQESQGKEAGLSAHPVDEKQAKKAEAIAKAKAALQKKQAEQEKEASQPAQLVDEKQAKKAEAIAKAKAALQKKQAEQEKEASLPAQPADDKQAKKAEAIAKVKAAAQQKQVEKIAAKQFENKVSQPKHNAYEEVTTSKTNKKQPMKEKKKKDKTVSKIPKRISKKLAWSIILFAMIMLGSSSVLAMKVLVWNDYGDSTKIEKQYRENIQKLKETPTDLDVRYELLVTMYNKGLLEEGRGQLTYILEHAEKDSTLFWKSVFYKALYASLDGHREVAISDFDAFLEKYPDHGEAWINLSFLYFSIGDYDKAAGAAGKASLFSPDSPDIPYIYAMLASKDNNLKEARILLEKALEIDANHEKSIELLETIQKRSEK